MIAIAAAVLIAAAAVPDIPVARVADDARSIDRFGAYAKHDLPDDLIRRMLTDDIELLRGKRSDGTYAYAGFERFESGRTSESFSVERPDQRMEVRGSFVYRLLISVPSRRLLLIHNRKVHIDRVEIEYIPVKGNSAIIQNVKIDTTVNPGETKSVDLQEIARQATVRVFGSPEKEGYGNVVLSLIQGRVFDNPDSPYADAVQSANAILRALDHDDVPSIRAMATRLANDLQPATTTAEVTAPAPATPDVYRELLAIEDLLHGSEAERLQGLDRIHELVRKLRP
ncbi:MAG TPA: hypothetical protein VKH35_09160 [Thermoanaerobaculia bacterium]|nr:hypothetical protein [Thermoanaerobaculia bacterium]